MTKNTTQNPKTAEEVKNSFDGYFNGLADSAEKFVEGVANARERNSRIMDKFLETVVKGQKDMLQLSRAVASAPADYKSNLQLAMETMTRRQECALDFGKTLYKEQTELSAAVSERAEELLTPLKNADFDLTAPYKKMTEFWTTAAK